MKIDIVEYVDNTTLVLDLILGKDNLTVMMPKQRKRNMKPVNLFQHINEYFLKLPKKDKDLFFKTAQEIEKGSMSSTFTLDEVRELKKKVYVGIKTLNWSRFLEWFRGTKDGIFSEAIGESLPPLPIPDTVKEEFVYNVDKGDTDDKTYVVKDLVELVALVTFLRMLIPYYNDYFTYSTKDNLHPTYKVFELFIGSDIDTEEGPLAKLREYIGANYDSIHGKGDNQGRIIDYGVSDDDVVDVLVAMSLFDKLLLADFFYSNSNHISHIYNAVNYGGRFRSSGKGNINLKSVDRNKDENEYAFFENYRKSTNLSPGMLEVLRFAHSNDAMIVQGLGEMPENYDWDAYRAELEHMKVYMENEIDPMKIYLLSWILKDAVGPRAIFTLENRRLIELMLLCKVFLMSRGHHFIAAVLSTVHDEESNFVNTSVTVKNSLSKELNERLESLFNYVIVDRVPSYEKPIIEFSKLLTNMAWKVYGSVHPDYVTSDGYLNTPNNVSDLLVDYVEFVLTLDERV